MTFYVLKINDADMIKCFQETKYITVDMKYITVPLSLRSCNLFLKTTLQES